MNIKALSVREIFRWRGFLRFPISYISKWEIPLGPPTLLPVLWDDKKCSESDLSSGFFESTEESRSAMLKSGFTIVGYMKTDPIARNDKFGVENGCIRYLHTNNRIMATLIYGKRKKSNGSGIKISVDISMNLKIDNMIYVSTNAKTLFDPAPNTKRAVINTKSPEVLLEALLEMVGTKINDARSIDSIEEYIAYDDRFQWELLERWIKRKLYVLHVE